MEQPAWLLELGWGAFHEAQAQVGRIAPEQLGRVVSQHRDACRTATHDAVVRAALAASLRGDRPVTGDWVVLDLPSGGGRAIVRDVLDRRTALVRKAPGRRTDVQVLAANVDVVFLVAALNDTRNAHRLERYLALASDSGADPVVVLTKADVAVPGLEAELVRAAQDVAVVRTSAPSGEGVEDVQAHLRGNRTAVLLGQSGAGKSTLLNALYGRELQETAGVRASDNRGRHTTTGRELVLLPGGGCIIDTPGVREIGLWDAHGLDRSFADIAELAASCRFRDCRHASEPGCAVLAAVASRDMDAGRLARHRKMQRELDHLDRRRDGFAAADTKRRWKAITKSVRANPKERW